MQIKLQHNIKRKNATSIRFDLCVEINEEHSIVGVFGPSGAGKTSLLKIMAGLVANAECSLSLNGKTYTNAAGPKNPCVYIGADSPLFEHLNVSENLSLIEHHSTSRVPGSIDIERVIMLCRLQNLLTHYPWQLSSGEKQRVIFARALLSGKKMLLLDEAFSALDWATRQLMISVVKHLVDQYNYRAIMVSHSLKELSLCASELITVEQGAVVNHVPLTIALEYQLENDSNKSANANDYFSVIQAQFSHVDKDDSTLQVWLLSNACAPIFNTSENVLDTCKLYVKSAANIPIAGEVALPTQEARRTFVLDANQMSVSRDQHNQTSMVNCFPVKVNHIAHTNSGVVLSANWYKQTLRAAITKKSFKSLNIQLNENLYFVCKALS
jgi:ABC-type molybdate transport system ATPase subunit